ncbi:MAG: ABC transporter permease [Piscirickettsiaceae bacterium]|nr:MAG: ABC transporter permease [Piscirickettsiaceae bacterium]PCI68442.1 MAG: ABC transporter permease [Piscirickettsiaceae bacterium]
MNSIIIAGRELRSLFLSPLAWTMLGVTQLILAYMFLTQIDFYLSIQPKLIGIPGAPGITDLVIAPLYGNAAVIFLLITPLITMRLISDERRNKTISLLFSAPISITDIILGKFLATLAFLLVILLSITLMPLSLLPIAEIDVGKLMACLLAMLLLLAAFDALGLYMSAIASQPTVAAVCSFGALLFLWIIDWAGSNSGNASPLFEYISMMRHFENLLKGLVHSTDVLYFILFIVGFLILSIRRLDNDRLQK